ncbi:phospholipase D-like domain-containing protein [Sphingomonas hankyongi]|uniref:Phospholipase D n=1 Tax=Sphingomonas hankyongi TaxID=2908209 RepID=A0ABT0S4E8_9SPHN|nr:phosphatidylserine/phosphatidylglycerophosphate/cardiolipin synthase family protein [Sphingomonas hankyongi]MCL6730742.1 phosphatidylserine/phosphatidylglycerophosphate/cardiolipin synthase family protein [Sphingomonas hankyongi]
MADASSEPVSSPPIRAEIAGNRLELIESGEARLEMLLELIAGAQESVRMLMYMFNPDRGGDVVRHALAAAAARGVEVKLLIDSFGSAATPQFFSELAEKGGEYCVFNPSFGRRYLLRNHQKLIVIDGQTVLIGGANIDATYLNDRGSTHWRDLWLRLDGPEAALPARYFDSLFRWSKRPRSKMRSLRRLIGEFSEWRGPLQWKFSGPMSRRNSWWRSIGRDIGQARRLDMIFAYFAPPGAMLRRIGRVGHRGEARVVNAAKSDNNATVAAARHSYSRLLRRHVRLYEYQPAKLHTKLAIVDDIVHIGSSNFDYRSFYINMEIMLRVKDAHFAHQMRAYFERELKDCKWITPELHARRATMWRRIKWAVSHFLVNVTDYTVTRRLNFRIER